jgi:5-oxoprolinase (ATP-hydrolysing) subunit A
VTATIDLNADVGEVDDPGKLESALFAIVTSVNIATGAHAGNPMVMDAAVVRAAALGVRIGAHPSYPDRAGFGRSPVEMAPERLRVELLAQLGALEAIARSHAQQMGHVKPHGALYHRVVTDTDCAAVVADVLRSFPGTRLVVPAGIRQSAGAGNAATTAARVAGIGILVEAFVDRAYKPDATLVDRSEPGALLTDPEAAAEQAMSIATRGGVRAIDGTWVDLEAETLCLHGDTPDAPAIGRTVRSALEDAGVTVTAPRARGS